MKKSDGFRKIFFKVKSVDWELDGRYPENFRFEGNLVWNFKKEGNKNSISDYSDSTNCCCKEVIGLFGTSLIPVIIRASIETLCPDGRNADSTSGKKKAPLSG